MSTFSKNIACEPTLPRACEPLQKATIVYTFGLYFTKMISKKEKKILLQFARSAIISYPKVIYPDSNTIPNALKEKKGAFVTLYVDGQLRGCVGKVLPVLPLYKAVIESAVSAAYADLRFPTLTKEEFNKIRIEISVLTDAIRLDYIDSRHLLKKLNSEEGIIIKNGLATATFLPQVWKQVPGREQFLEQLCLKARLSTDAWKDSDVEVYAYKAEKFSN